MTDPAPLPASTTAAPGVSGPTAPAASGSSSPDPTAAQPGLSVFGSRAWSPFAAFWLVTLTFLVSLLGSLVIREVLSRDFTDSTAAALAGGVLVLGYVIELAVVRAVTHSYGAGFSETVGLVRPQGRSTLAWVSTAIVGALVARAFAAAYELLVNRLGVHIPGADSDVLSVFPGSGLSVLILLAVVVVIAPFAEEVVFRGVLMPSLGVRWGTVAGLAGSSAVFAVFHMNVYLLLPIAVAAVIFGGMAIRFRSLWPAYIGHAVFNGVAAVAVLVLKSRGLT